MRLRRAGQSDGPVPLRARRAVEVSPREACAPARLGCIRGIAPIAEARRQTEPAWREVWADDGAGR